MPTQSQSQSEQPKAVKSGRGFAAMDQAKQRAIASKGGKAAHESGRAHEFTSEEAREAGRKGGEAAHESGRAHEFTSEEAREAGRKGGEASHANRLNRVASGGATIQSKPKKDPVTDTTTPNLGNESGRPASSNLSDPGRPIQAAEPMKTANTAEPARSANATEPMRTSSTTEPAQKTNATDSAGALNPGNKIVSFG